MRNLNKDEKDYIYSEVRKRYSEFYDKVSKKLYDEIEKLEEKLEISLNTDEDIVLFKELADKLSYKIEQNMQVLRTCIDVNITNIDRTANHLHFCKRYYVTDLNVEQRNFFNDICSRRDIISEYNRRIAEENLIPYYIEFSTWKGIQSERLKLINKLIDKICKEVLKIKKIK